MLHGVDTLSKTFIQLDQATFNFTLTGSRYFGSSNELSDWDFFAVSCDAIREFLSSQGFIPRTIEKYQDDSSIAQVWRLSSIPFVDVQLVHSDILFRAKIYGQKLLKRLDILNPNQMQWLIAQEEYHNKGE